MRGFALNDAKIRDALQKRQGGSISPKLLQPSRMIGHSHKTPQTRVQPVCSLRTMLAERTGYLRAHWHHQCQKNSRLLFQLDLLAKV